MSQAKHRSSPRLLRQAQAGILQEVPAHAAYLVFDLAATASRNALHAALKTLAARADGEQVVVGLGPVVARAVGWVIAGLHEPVAMQTIHTVKKPSIAIAPTPAALVLWLRAQDKAQLERLKRAWLENKTLAAAFALREAVQAFRHTVAGSDSARDLTGYEDGTENPTGVKAKRAALHQGASFWVLQKWQHDWAKFNALRVRARDLAIGRLRQSNEEIEDAPNSAHVKRTAQEDFAPQAFVLRRSMPWQADPAEKQGQSGLMFAAFGRDFSAFEAQMRRMSGWEDGVVDALFQFSRPLSTRYFWCPPMCGGQLDLPAL